MAFTFKRTPKNDFSGGYTDAFYFDFSSASQEEGCVSEKEIEARLAEEEARLLDERDPDTE